MWTIRPETRRDAAAVRDVHLRAFAPERTEADLVEALRAGDAYMPSCAWWRWTATRSPVTSRSAGRTWTAAIRCWRSRRWA